MMAHPSEPRIHVFSGFTRSLAADTGGRKVSREAALRDPREIIKEICMLDAESARVLQKIGRVL